MLASSSAYEPGWLLDVLPLRGGRARPPRCCSSAMNGQMLGLARLAYSLATNRQIPSAVGPAAPAPRHAVRGDRDRPR